jgi:hypothetical protein
MIRHIDRRGRPGTAEIRAISALAAKLFIMHDPIFAADSSCCPSSCPQTGLPRKPCCVTPCKRRTILEINNFALEKKDFPVGTCASVW